MFFHSLKNPKTTHTKTTVSGTFWYSCASFSIFQPDLSLFHVRRDECRAKRNLKRDGSGNKGGGMETAFRTPVVVAAGGRFPPVSPPPSSAHSFRTPLLLDARKTISRARQSRQRRVRKNLAHGNAGRHGKASCNGGTKKEKGITQTHQIVKCENICPAPSPNKSPRANEKTLYRRGFGRFLHHITIIIISTIIIAIVFVLFGLSLLCVLSASHSLPVGRREWTFKVECVFPFPSSSVPSFLPAQRECWIASSGVFYSSSHKLTQSSTL